MELNIVNDALSLIREPRLENLDSSEPLATICKTSLPTVIDDVLEHYPFKAAIKRVRLAKSSYAPAWGYRAMFEIPQDCLRILRVEDNITFRREGNYILANAENLNIIYTARIAVDDMDSRLKRLVTLRLAVHLAQVWAENDSLTQIIQAQYLQSLKKLSSVDALESNNTVMQTETPWINARYK